MTGLEVRELGLREYGEVLALQRRLVEERLAGGPDVLLLVEHPPVFTRGTGLKAGSRVPIQAEDPLGGPPVPVFDVERGGGVTYHGPGQLVGYPIVHLKERDLGLAEYLRLLEDALIEAASPWARCERLPAFTGVWSGGRKVASIGVAVRRWVSFHGFALNVSTDLSFFRRIYPCGLEPSQMTSLERLSGGRVPPGQVRQRLAGALDARLKAPAGVS